MAYTLPWGTKHPGFLIYLLDLSGSMKYNGKIDDMIDIITSVSDYLIEQSRDHGVLQNDFSLNIIGYNTDTTILFPNGDLMGTVIDLDNALEKADMEKRKFLDKEKEAKPQWQTFTAKAFRETAKVVQAWIDRQERSDIKNIPTPIVIHITDGYPYEGEGTKTSARQEALKAAEELKSISVPDGNVLLFNIHIEPNDNLLPLAFPATAPTDEERKFLFEATSVLPNNFLERAKRWFPQDDIREGSRFMVSNEIDKRKLAKLIAFGSVVSSRPNATPFTYESGKSVTTFIEPPKP